MLPSPRHASWSPQWQEQPAFDPSQDPPSPHEPVHENLRDSTEADLERDPVPWSGRDSPIDLNEHDKQATAAQANMFWAHAAALHALLGDDDDDEANPQQDEEEIPTVVQL